MGQGDMEGLLVAERYRLERLLGKGAMGSVWLARHLSLGTEVAVKVIHADAARNQRARARFEREAKVVARIDSAHVAGVLDHGSMDDGRPYIVMEFLHGETVRERLDKQGRLSPRETARIVSHVARALTKAHALGLVHRDIKPENIFIAQVDDEEVVKVVDFGIAKATDVMMSEGMDPTKTGAMLGTPHYMSPEQARGLKSVDGRADLWSLGVVAYECLTGQPPFVAAALGPLIARILAGTVVPASTLAPDNVAPEVDRWFARALASLPEQRFASARELAESFRVATRAVDSIEHEGGIPAVAPALAPRQQPVDQSTIALEDPDQESVRSPGAALPFSSSSGGDMGSTISLDDYASMSEGQGDGAAPEPSSAPSASISPASAQAAGLPPPTRPWLLALVAVVLVAAVVVAVLYVAG